MEEPICVFGIIRRPGKLGSGRQTTRRPFALTTRFAGLPQKRRGVAAPHQTGAAAANGLAALATPSAQLLAQRVSSTDYTASQEQGALAEHVVALSAPIWPVSGVVPEQNPLDPQAGSGPRLQVQVTATRRKGSGRQTTPRQFLLNVKLPELRRHTEQPQSPQQQQPMEQLRETQQQPSPQFLQPEPGSTATGSHSTGLLPLSVPSPQLIVDLFYLAQKTAREQAGASPGGLGGRGTPLKGMQPPSDEAAATSQHNALTAAKTPAPRRIGCLSHLMKAALSPRSPWHAPTPIEGVPERFSLAWPPGNAAAAPSLGSLGSSEACSSSGVGMTPIEGVPERLTKRRRISILPPAHWPLAALENTPRVKNRLADAAGKNPGQDSDAAGLQRGGPLEAGTPAEVSAAEGRGADFALGLPGAAQADAVAEPRAACSPAADGGPLPAGAGVAGNLAADGPAPRELVKESMTATDVAAAVSAAARAALARLQALVQAQAQAQTPVGSPGAEAAAGPSAAADNTVEVSDTSTVSSTPAVVKIQNLAMTVADAVQRAQQAIRGAPSSSGGVHSLPRSGLPPRPPSARGLVAAKSSAASARADSIAKMSVGSAQRRTSFALDGQPGLGSLIHRAAPDALIFPSRTPSPMFGFQWLPQPQVPAVQVAAALANAAGMAAVTPGATLPPFGAAAAADSPGVPADRRGPAVAAHSGSGSSPEGSDGGLAGGAAVRATAETPGGRFGRAGVSVDAAAARLPGALESVLRHDMERHFAEDEEVAPAEAMTLPDESEPLAAEPLAQGDMRSDSTDANSQPPVGQQQQQQQQQEPAVEVAAAPACLQGPHRASEIHALEQHLEVGKKRRLPEAADQPRAADAPYAARGLNGVVCQPAQGVSSVPNGAPYILPFGVPALIGGFRWMPPPVMPGPQAAAGRGGSASVATDALPPNAPFVGLNGAAAAAAPCGAYNAAAPAAAVPFARVHNAAPAAATAVPVVRVHCAGHSAAAVTSHDVAPECRVSGNAVRNSYGNAGGQERSAGGRSSHAGTTSSPTTDALSGRFRGSGGNDGDDEDDQEEGPAAGPAGYGERTRSAGGRLPRAETASGPAADAPSRSFHGIDGGDDNDDSDEQEDEDDAPAAGPGSYGEAQRSASGRSGARNASGPAAADVPEVSLSGDDGGDDRGGDDDGDEDEDADDAPAAGLGSYGEPQRSTGERSSGAGAANGLTAGAPAGSTRGADDEDDEDEDDENVPAAGPGNPDDQTRSTGGRSSGAAAASGRTTDAPGPSFRGDDDNEEEEDGGEDGDGDEDQGQEDAPGAGPGDYGEPTPGRGLASVLRHDLEQRDSDDEELAMKEVRALPDEPEPARGSNRSSGAGPSSQPAAAQQQQQQREAAQTSQRQSEKHAVARRQVGNRKSLAGVGLTIDEMGTRRSTRTRVRPLEYWRGELKTYDRAHATLPTVKTIKMRTPEPAWPLPSGKEEKARRRARTKQKADAEAAAAAT